MSTCCHGGSLSNARLLLSLIILSVANSAGAESVSEKARAYYDAGTILYRASNYREAIDQFAAGYELSLKPRFLVNMGQAYYELGELEKARELYLRFLSNALPDAPERAEVERLIVKVEVDLKLREARERPIQPQERVDTVDMDNSAASKRLEPTPTGSESNVIAPGPRTDRVAASKIQLHPAGRAVRWRWVVLGAGVAVLAAIGVGLAVGLATSSTAPPAGDLGLYTLTFR